MHFKLIPICASQPRLLCGGAASSSGSGSDTETKTDYLHVFDPGQEFPYNLLAPLIATRRITPFTFYWSFHS